MSVTGLIRYALVFLAVAVGVGLLVKFLNARTESTLGSSAQLMVPAMIAAAIEGSRFARMRKRKPQGVEAWNFAWAAAAVATALNLVLAYYGGSLLPEFARLAAAPAPSQQFFLLLGLYAGGYLIFNRVFLGLGAGNQLSLMRSRGEID